MWNMLLIVVTKLGLLVLCQKAGGERTVAPTAASENYDQNRKAAEETLTSVIKHDSTMEALALDHLNDCLSNIVAAIALMAVLVHPSMWWVDPLGAMVVSAYIMYSWFSTGRKQIEQLTGRTAPKDFVEEIRGLVSKYDPHVIVDACRAYHFGPKFLVEIDIVLPEDTLLRESHDIGMNLQYKIEAKVEVERCFVHIDYEKREYDEHVVSKVPELLALIQKHERVTTLE